MADKPDARKRRGPGKPFAKGNDGGPGRPTARFEREYVEAIKDACKLDDWKDVLKATLTRAKAGSLDHAEFFAKRLVGQGQLADLLRILDGPATARSVLEELLTSSDPAIRLQAAKALLDSEQSSSNMQAWLQAVRDAGGTQDMQRPEGANPWQPEGES